MDGWIYEITTGVLVAVTCFVSSIHLNTLEIPSTFTRQSHGLAVSEPTEVSEPFNASTDK